MHDYELVFLVSPQVADEQVPAVSERVRQFVTERGGSVTEMKPWGRRRMAYHIGNFQEASYIQANFSMEPKYAHELEESLRLAEDVIRHLLVIAERAKPAEAAKTKTEA
ncbi:MAG: ribosomal protein [Dehalococcoidia bacterium]|nr:ribosomal protein [Dehalococcoidia bacterium]